MPFRRMRKHSKRSGASAGKKALAKVNKLEKQREKKLIDLDSVDDSSDVIVINPITLIAQGDTSSSREGAKVVYTSIQMKYTFKQNTSATFTRCRIMLVLDKQCNGALFTAGDLLQTTAVGQAIISPLNLDGAFRFKVLYNKVHTLSVDGSGVQYGEMFKKINIPARYSGNGGAIGDVLSSCLYIVHMSDEASLKPKASYYTRVRFIDS